MRLQKLSRKLVHITTGLLFMLSWPLFRCVVNKQVVITEAFSESQAALFLTRGPPGRLIFGGPISHGFSAARWTMNPSTGIMKLSS